MGASRRGIVWIACCVRVCECVYVLVSGQVKFRVLLESAISKPMTYLNKLKKWTFFFERLLLSDIKFVRQCWL